MDADNDVATSTSPTPTTSSTAGLRGVASRTLDALSGDSARIWIPALSGLLALGICCYQLSLPNVLLGIHGYTGNGYDDGVYLGAATRLVHGVLPYRDFDFLHPPGITIVLSPVALLGRIIGTRDAMALARILTALVTGLNAALAALAVRNCGKVAMAVAGGALALFPLSVAADQSVLLEPYLVFFCLLGVLALFSKGGFAKPRRVLLAGILFGFAVCTKLWAVLPAVAALACCAPRWRRGLTPFAIGLVLGFGVPSFIFFVAAPHAFFHDVVTAQLHRGTSGLDALSIAQRLVMILGLTGLPGLTATTGLAVGLFIAFVALVTAVYVTTWRQRSWFDWFVLAANVIVLLGMFWSAEFYDHYAYFPAAFLALLLGICAAQVATWVHQLAQHRPFAGGRVLHIAVPVVVVAGVLTVTVVLLQQDSSYASTYLADSADPAAAVSAQIPEGACVTFDYAVFAINANRFNPAGPGCPATVDPFGMWLTRDNGTPPPAQPPFPADFTEAWQGWFNAADYVILSVPYSNYIPWTHDLALSFQDSYVLVSAQPRTYVYTHHNRSPSPAAQTDIREGTLAARLGKPDQAIADFRQALAQDPADTDAIFDIGVVDQQFGRPAAASSAYNRVIFLDPHFVSALYNLAVLNTKTSPANAISLYQTVLKIRPNDADAQFNLGLLLIQQGQTTTGLQLLQSATVAEPSLTKRIPAGIKVP